MVTRVTHAVSYRGLRFIAGLLTAIACSVVAPAKAGATLLAPGGSVNPAATTFAPGLWVDELPGAFLATGGEGSFLSEVWQVTAGGYLDFYYQVRVVDSVLPGLVGISVATNTAYEDYVITDVFVRNTTSGMLGTGFIDPTPGLAVQSVSRPAGTNELVINFQPSVSTGPLGEDQYSPIVIVRTNSYQYTTGNGRLTGMEAGGTNVAILTPIPEPGSLLLLGSGLAGLAGLARLRRKAHRTTV
jgi:hypothetical protein